MAVATSAPDSMLTATARAEAIMGRVYLAKRYVATSFFFALLPFIRMRLDA